MANFNVQKVLYVMAVSILFCLTACAAEPEPLSYPEYEALAFDTSYLSYLGRSAEDVAAELDATGEWEDISDDSSVPSRPHRLEQVMVDGDAYECYMRLNGSEAWSVSFAHVTDSASDEEKNAAVQKVYDLLVSELGEPEALAGGHSVGEGLEEGLKCAVVGKDVLPEQYVAWWVLDEDVKMASDPESDMVLTCHFTVNYAEDSVAVNVDYALYQPSGLYEIARFAAVE